MPPDPCRHPKASATRYTSSIIQRMETIMGWKLGNTWTAPLPEGTKARRADEGERRRWSRANVYALGGIAVLACDEAVIAHNIALCAL